MKRKAVLFSMVMVMCWAFIGCESTPVDFGNGGKAGVRSNADGTWDGVIEHFNGRGGWNTAFGAPRDTYRWWNAPYPGFDTDDFALGSASLSMELGPRATWDDCFGHNFAENPDLGVKNADGFTTLNFRVKSTVKGYVFTFLWLSAPLENAAYYVNVPVAKKWVNVSIPLDSPDEKRFTEEHLNNLTGWIIGFWGRWNPSSPGPRATVKIDAIWLE
ncbi:MAG: hypothetical protein FWD36_03780 [Treponema sp.]|nr:hypothetical protein [Treponema sp.]